MSEAESAAVVEAEIQTDEPAPPPVVALLNTQVFRDVVRTVGRAVHPRSAKTALQSVCLTFDPSGNVTATATDMDCSIRTTFPASGVEQAGSVLIPHERLRRIVDTFQDDTLRLETTESGVRFSGLRCHWELLNEDAANYPAPNTIPRDAGWHVVSAADLRLILDRTGYATDPKSSRYALGGILFEQTDTTLKGVSTDGHRVAIQEVPARTIGQGAMWNSSAKTQTILPLRLVKHLEALLPDDDTEVHYSFNNNANIFMRFGSIRIWSQLLSGRFPNYGMIEPKKREATFDVPAADLAQVVRLAVLAVDKEETRGVRFSLKDGQIHVETTDADELPDKGKPARNKRMKAAAPALFGQETFSWVADPEYLLEFLDAVPKDAVVTLDLEGPKAPILVRPTDQEPLRPYRYIFMPMG